MGAMGKKGGKGRGEEGRRRGEGRELERVPVELKETLREGVAS